MKEKKLPAKTVTRTLAPGQNGTKKLQAVYGAELLVVRYRKDRPANYKTVELIVSRRLKKK